MIIKRTLFICIYTLLYIVNANSQNILSYVAYDDMKAWADSVLKTLTPEERLGQLIIPIVGNNDTPEQRNIIRNDIEKYHVGGLLFSKGTLSSQEALTKYGQSISKKVPLMITTDSEWGLNMRLTDAIRFPKNMALGCINHAKRSGGTTLRDSLMYEYGFEVGQECKAMGISVNFAPVLDINNNPKNPVIGNRSFGDNFIDVATAALSYSSGVEDAGVLAVGKHFPGHGDTDKDSHKTLPLLSHSKFRMESFEMRPFQEFIKAGFGGIMVGHLEVPFLEPTNGMPSSASKEIITTYLRDKYKFNGLAFTDGLAMEGARRYPGFCAKSLNAGIDILLDPINLSDQWNNLQKALKDGSLTQDLIDQKCLRVLMFKYALQCGNLPNKNKVNTSRAEKLSKELYQQSLVLLKNNAPLEGSTIINVANAKAATIAQVKQQVQSAQKPITLVFYTTPFNLVQYKDVIAKASSVILAHEDYKFAHEAVQNTIEGKTGFNGQLCVEIPDLYKSGDGIITFFEQPKPVKEEIAKSSIPEVDNQILLQIDSLVNDGLEKGAFPGCQVLVAKNGEIIYNKAFGWLDNTKTTKVNTETMYDLASVSKAVGTLPALMLAIDEFGITINEKLSKYIPLMRGTDKQNLTIKQALFHETGMRDGYPFYGLTIDSASVNNKLYSSIKDDTYNVFQDNGVWFNKNLKYNTEWITKKADKTHTLQIAEDMFVTPKFRDEMLKTIIGLRLRNVGRYRYSDLNFILLRNVIEAKTKKTLDAYLEEKLFTPLGLSFCSYLPRQKQNINHKNIAPTEDDQAIRKQLLVGFVHDEAAAWSGGVEGNAGLFSNATDVATILQMLLDDGTFNGKQIISEKTCKLFTTTKSTHSRRGLGFDKPDCTNTDKSPCAPETPHSVFGHTGYTGTCFWVDPTNKMIYIFLSNRVNPSRTNNLLSVESYRSRIQSILYDKLVR